MQRAVLCCTMSRTKANLKGSILLSCFRQGERTVQNAVCQVHRGINLYAAKGALQNASKREEIGKRNKKGK